MNNQYKINVYVCAKCSGKTRTIDVDNGVTPFMMMCRATENCDGTMRSSFYSVPQNIVPEYEWFMPKSMDGYDQDMIEHFKKGGLDIRKIEPPIGSREEYPPHLGES